MPRAAGKAAGKKVKARAPVVTPKKRPAPRAPPVPPVKARAVTEAERRAAFAEAEESVRARLWGEQGQPLTTVGGVTIAFAQLPKSTPHWHLLTFGLAPVGFELSIRVAKGKEEVAPPAWPVQLLSSLITRAQSKALTGDTNQIILLGENITAAVESQFTGLLFTLDPDAGMLVTKHDSAPVLLAVPIAADEVRAVREWSPSGLIDVLQKVDPLTVTDLDRASLLQSPRARAMIDQRMEREGSSLSSITSESSSIAATKAKITWTLSRDTVETVIGLLKGRIGHQRAFSVVSPNVRVDVVNADAPSVAFDQGVCTLKLSLVAARQMRSILRAKAGTYTFEPIPRFELVVEGA